MATPLSPQPFSLLSVFCLLFTPFPVVPDGFSILCCAGSSNDVGERVLAPGVPELMNQLRDWRLSTDSASRYLIPHIPKGI